MVHADHPVMFYTQVFALYEHLRRHVLHTGGDPALARASVRLFRVLDFTCTFGVVFYNRGDRADSLEHVIRGYLRPVSCYSFPFHQVSSDPSMVDGTWHRS